MLTLPRLVFLLLATCSLLVGAVTRSPFLPPGYESRPKPTDVAPPTTVAKPTVQNVKITNEIEFRGYFSLGRGEQRKMGFSLFNKKLNRGEWVSLGEKTTEDFEVAAFDMDSETLTVRYGGSTAELSLHVSRASPSSPGKPGVVKAPASAVTSTVNVAKASGPRVMPPRPKNTPTLPPWLAARAPTSGSRSVGASSGSRPRSVTSSGGAFPVSPPLAPRFPVSSSPTVATPPGSGGGSSTGHVLAPVTLTAPSSSAPPPSSAAASPEGSSVNSVSSGTLDLENLPPPPPPPDILPPGPPPNIVPSRD